MNQKYCLDKKEWKEAQAALLLAKQLGLIEDAGIGALEKRRAEKNEKNRMEMFADFSIPDGFSVWLDRMWEKC